MVVAFILLLGLANAQAGETPEPLQANVQAATPELAAYLEEAAKNNPQLRAKHAAWQAAMQRIPQAKSLKDPMFSYGQFLQSEVSRARIMISQKFPWLGTLRARGDKAAAEADAVLQEFFDLRNTIFANTKQVYYEYAFLAERAEIAEAQLALLDYMEDVVESKLALGLANQDELLRVTISQDQLNDRLAAYKSERPVLAARLNALLGRDTSEELPWPGGIAMPAAPPEPEALMAQIAANPSLAAAEQRIEGARTAVELARKEGYPDFTLGLEYVSISKPRQIRPDRPFPATLNAANRLATNLGAAAGGAPLNPIMTGIDLYALSTADEPFSYSDGGEDNIMLSLTMNVPIWRKKVRAGIAEAELMESSKRYEKHRTRLAIETAAHQALFTAKDAKRRYALYSDSLIPQAEQSYESLLSQYSAPGGGADFLDVLGGVDKLLLFELEKAHALFDWRRGMAELEYLAGGSLTPDPSPETPEDATPE